MPTSFVMWIAPREASSNWSKIQRGRPKELALNRSCIAMRVFGFKSSWYCLFTFPGSAYVRFASCPDFDRLIRSSTMLR